MIYNLYVCGMTETVRGMKTSDEYYEYLDNLLEKYYFNSNDFIVHETNNPIVISLNPDDWGMNLAEHDGCESKLIYDKFIESDITNYKITFEGSIFYLDGGYKQRRLSEQAELNRISVLEKNADKSGTQMVLLTSVLVFASLVAAWYYLHELWVYYFVP